ncbi:hypothetical protein [Methylobacterium fujisawaense]|uniref:hypothetical protein n=1 Tax=Methylobacterium fujisawaense TaxID=107400 RepID=UPI00244AF0A0|nr:hypothetical protein [Methylobacterium fujisawaense]MDH3032566.1 hypothetical protein [Methylobacterium fujisawaense]
MRAAHPIPGATGIVRRVTLRTLLAGASLAVLAQAAPGPARAQDAGPRRTTGAA